MKRLTLINLRLKVNTEKNTRNKSGGVTAGMFKATAAGWEEIDLGTALNFDGTTINGAE